MYLCNTLTLSHTYVPLTCTHTLQTNTFCVDLYSPKTIGKIGNAWYYFIWKLEKNLQKFTFLLLSANQKWLDLT